MLIIKNFKFLVYKFNNYLNRQGKPMEKIRHTIISEDGHGLLELQKRIGLIS